MKASVIYSFSIDSISDSRGVGALPIASLFYCRHTLLLIAPIDPPKTHLHLMEIRPVYVLKCLIKGVMYCVSRVDGDIVFVSV